MRSDKAASILGVKATALNQFELQDPFNPQNTLHGFITTSDALYGSMVLYQVNNHLTEQVIIGTPKQHYPFDKLGRWLFPVARKVNVYEKLDGTNILAYKYKVAGKEYVTYKTRLTPILRDGRWGNFCAMWREMLEKHPSLSELIADYVMGGGINLSFELYGARNKHLIDYYPVLLDVALLFGIHKTSTHIEILDPQELSPHGVPVARLVQSIKSGKELTSWYQKLREQQEAINQTTEDGIVGSEGFVWYLEDSRRVIHQYKCKPETIERIHWASSGISKGSVTTTIMNAYESTDNVTLELVTQLLKEEFDERTIEAHHYMILGCMEQVKTDLEFRDRVLHQYQHLGLDLSKDKAATMRALSEHFPKNLMRKTYSILKVYVEKPKL